MHDLQPLLVPVHQAFTHSQGPLLSAAGQTLELHCGAATRHEPSAWQGRARLRKHAGRETGERGTGRHVELALQPLKLIVRLRQPALQRGRRRRRAGRRPHSLLGQPPEVAAERGRARGVRHQRQLRDAHACGGAASARARAAAPNRAPHPLAGFQCVQCAASRGGAVRGASAAQPVQAARPHRKLPGSTWPTRAARRRRAAHPLPASRLPRAARRPAAPQRRGPARRRPARAPGSPQGLRRQLAPPRRPQARGCARRAGWARRGRRRADVRSVWCPAASFPHSLAKQACMPHSRQPLLVLDSKRVADRHTSRTGRTC